MAWWIQDISSRDRVDPRSAGDEAELRAEVARLTDHPPRVVAVGPVGSGYLQVGVGGPWAFVEYCQDKPWRAEAAVPAPSSRTAEPPESVWYECGGQGSEIPGEYLLPIGRATDLVVEILYSGKLPQWVGWEPM
jgi:hypothetical protein